MLLVEIGYDAKAAGMTGTDWAINTSKLIATTGLMNGIDGSVNQVITREKAAQMALNALKTPTVEYDTKGSSISVNGAEINFGASTPKYVTSELASARNISSDQLSNQNGYTVELGEKLYKDLKKTATTDAFGRDASKWSIKSEVIGTYVDKSDLVETYTAKASKGALYTLVGSDVVSSLKSTKEDSGVLTVYQNGKEVKNPAVASYFDKNNSGAAGISGNGVVTEVYMNKDYDVKIIQINTYLVQATDDYSAKKESVSIATVDIGSNLPALPSTISIDDFDVADVKEDDYLLVTYADDAIQSVKAAKMLEGVVSEYTENDYVVIDGTKYSYNNIATTTAETDFSVTYNAKVVLDEYGYILHVDTAVSNSNYLYVRVAKDVSGLGKTVKADAYFTDGTSKEIELKKVDSTANNAMNTSFIDGLASKWFTYAVNDKGQYILTSANYHAAFDESTATTDANKNIIANDVVKFLGDAASFTTELKGLKANADTLFLIRDADGDVSVYTGIANVPTVKTITGVQSGDVKVSLITNKAGTYATKVFVDVTCKDHVKILGANAGDWMFLLKDTGNTTYVDGSSYKQYKVLFEGEETTKYIESTIGIKVGELGYNIKENSKGYVTDVTKFEADSNTYEVEDLANDTITKSGKTLSVGGVDYILTDDTVINLIVGKGCSLLKDKSASYETYLKITGSTLASILYKYEITKGQAFAVIDKKDSDTLKTLYVYVAAGKDIVEQVASVKGVKIDGKPVETYSTFEKAMANPVEVADQTSYSTVDVDVVGTKTIKTKAGLDSSAKESDISYVNFNGANKFGTADKLTIIKITADTDNKSVTAYVAVKAVTYYTLKVENSDLNTAIMVNGTVVSKAASSSQPTTVTLKEKLVKGDEVSVTYVVEDGGTIGDVTVEGASATIFNKTITFTVETSNVTIKVADKA